jgi:hypothetical protein
MRVRTFVPVLILLCALPLGAEDDKISKLMARAAENAAKGQSFGTLRFDQGTPDPILAFSWGVSNSGSIGGGGGGAGKVTFSDIHIVKAISKSSSTIFKDCANGKHFKQVTLEVSNEKGQPYLQVTMSNVLITSYQTGGSSGDALLENVTLSAGNLEYILIGL